MTKQINGDKLFVIDPHPAIPPSDQLKKWEDEWFNEEEHADVLLIQAFQAGADQELEACCEVLARELICDGKHVATDLHMIRRPKPLSLKQQALEMLENAWEGGHINNNAAQTIRRALEALPE
jgi:predicted ATP-grasp superfamily ATP-dependent carboligase